MKFITCISKSGARVHMTCKEEVIDKIDLVDSFNTGLLITVETVNGYAIIDTSELVGITVEPFERKYE